MLKYFSLILLGISVINAATAQNEGEITGKLVGPNDEPLSFATVTVYRAADTSLVDYILSEDDGSFRIRRLPLGMPLRVISSFLGFEPHRADFELTPTDKVRDFGLIIMQPTSQTLDEILVQAERPPVVMDNDTIEFNAASFQTRDGATVEDLVKKLPGVVVDSDGNITANGRPVNKVRVDGKDFFGGDPRVALRNLTSDMIDKVQIAEDREEDPLRLKADDEVSQILNLKLKKDAKIQAFGKAYAGGGTNNRFEVGGIVNNFADTLQLSFVGYYNNLTQTNLSMHEMLSLGSFQAQRVYYTQSGASINGLNIGDSRSGLPLSLFGGANANLTLGDAKMSLQYFYSDYQNEFRTQTYKQTTLRPDSIFYFNADNEGKSKSRGHNLMGGLRWTIDTTTQLNLNVGLTYANGNRPSSQMETAAFNDETNIIQEFLTVEDPRSTNLNLNTRLYFNKRLNHKGRNLGFTTTFNKNNDDNDLLSKFQRLYLQNSIDSLIYFDQLRNKYTHHQSLSLDLRYSEPLISNTFLDLGVKYEPSSRSNEVLTRQQYPSDGDWNRVDGLSNDFDRKENKWGGSAALRYQKNKVQVNLGLDYDNLTFTNNFNEEFVSFDEEYQFISPRIQINLDGWRFNYNYTYRIPEIGQLHPITDNTNPLYIQEGNPDLTPYRGHNIWLSKYAYSGKWKYRLYLGSDFRNQSIINSSRIDADGITYVRPINFHGNSSEIFSGAGMNHTFEMQNQKLTLDLGLFGNLRSEPFIVNGQEGSVSNKALGTSINLNYNLNDILDFAPRYYVNFVKNEYDKVNFSDVSYVNHQLSGEFTIHLPWSIELQNDVTYTYLPNTIPGFPSSNLMWNAAINKKLLKNKKLTLRLSAYDLLDQNVNFYRSVRYNTVQDIQQTALTRYLMVSLIYDFRKANIPGRGGPGIIRIGG